MTPRFFYDPLVAFSILFNKEIDITALKVNPYQNLVVKNDDVPIKGLPIFFIV